MPGQCTQCQVLSINGLRCHETGCPIAWREYTKRCRNCKREFKLKEQRQEVCSKQCYRDFWGT